MKPPGSEVPGPGHDRSDAWCVRRGVTRYKREHAAEKSGADRRSAADREVRTTIRPKMAKLQGQAARCDRHLKFPVLKFPVLLAIARVMGYGNLTCSKICGWPRLVSTGRGACPIVSWPYVAKSRRRFRYV